MPTGRESLGPGFQASVAPISRLDRLLHLPGMIHAGDAVVRAFASVGWGWGGAWSGDKDYQHFSTSGR